MLTTILLAINVITLTYILLQSILVVNQMTKKTPHSLRSIYVALAVGSLYGLLNNQILYGPALISNIAVAYFVYTGKLGRCDITGVHKALNI